MTAHELRQQIAARLAELDAFRERALRHQAEEQAAARELLDEVRQLRAQFEETDAALGEWIAENQADADAADWWKQT